MPPFKDLEVDDSYPLRRKSWCLSSAPGRLLGWRVESPKRRRLCKLALWVCAMVLLTYILHFVVATYECTEPSNCWPSLRSYDQIQSTAYRSNLVEVEAAVNAVVNLPVEQPHQRTSLNRIVFGIAATADNWGTRREYVKMWWQPGGRMRGYVWLDRQPAEAWDDTVYPPYRISEPADQFNYTWEGGNPSAIRISRIASETARMNLSNIHWLVMCDDDTVFATANLVKVLSKYDHTLPYYIGSISESHFQNVDHSYSMGYGGAGFAISYPLVLELERMQDRCLHRYAHLYGSDGRIQACLAELGVPLTREPGFHQIDLRGSIFGLLAAHPVAPFVSLHHLDLVEPIFPSKDRFDSLRHLMKAVDNDPYGIIQQSMCYDKRRNLSISVSAGYALQIYKGIITPLELQKPIVTFVDWKFWRDNGDGFTYDTRPMIEDRCQWNVYFMDNVQRSSNKLSVTTYLRYPMNCSTSSPTIDEVTVFQEKQNLPLLQGARRQCCEVSSSFFPFLEKRRLEVSVRDCREGEIIAAER